MNNSRINPKTDDSVCNSQMIKEVSESYDIDVKEVDEYENDLNRLIEEGNNNNNINNNKKKKVMNL